MADNLDDEWWLTSGEIEEKETRLTQLTALENNKRPLEEDAEAVQEVKKKKKKRKKRKKLSEKLSKTEDKAGNSSDLEEWMQKTGDGSLSSVEAGELLIGDYNFMPHNDQRLLLSKYLGQCIPDWTTRVDNSNPKETKSCIVLILAASALRAADLNRAAAEFKGKCIAAKLFAKHMKIKEQAALLSKKKVHFAVGTPGRVYSLIEEGALTMEYINFIILDWNWRDVKLRRMIDMPELSRDLFKLLKTYIVPAAKKYNRIKVGLF